jgi:organic radical activating enzyme
MRFMSSVAVLLTEKCNLRCRHCIVASGPEKTEAFPEEWIDPFVHGIRRAGIRRLGITGGEPVLATTSLFKMIKAAQRAGIASTVATNGFWAEDERDAAELARRLKAGGVDRLLFSADQFHQRFISCETIARGARSAEQAGMAYEIHVTEPNGEEAWAVVSQLRKMGLQSIFSGGIEQAGRAVNFTDGEVVNEAIGRCAKVGNPLVLTDGRVIACCDLLVAPERRPVEGSALYYGHILQEDLPTILARAEQRAAIRALFAVGPEVAAEYAYENLGPKFDPGQRKGCGLCHWLLATRGLGDELDRAFTAWPAQASGLRP